MDYSESCKKKCRNIWKFQILCLFLQRNTNSKLFMKHTGSGTLCNYASLTPCIYYTFNYLIGTFYFDPFLRLHSRQSIWQFSTTVRPPSRHGVMWSPSINSKSNSLPQIGQI